MRSHRGASSHPSASYRALNVFDNRLTARVRVKKSVEDCDHNAVLITDDSNISTVRKQEGEVRELKA